MADLSSTDLIQRVRDLLYERPYETTSTTTTTSVTVAVVDGTRWEEGAIGEWQTGAVGGEQFYVQSVSVNNLTVVRGYAGTTAETHTSGDRILKNPTYTYRQILQAIQQAVLELWPYVFTTGTISLTPTTTPWYNLNAATLGIVNVVQLYGSSSEQAGMFGARGGHPYAIEFVLPTALVASGNGIKFPNGLFHATNTITVTDMRAVIGTTDIKDSGNFPVAECVTYGAAARLFEALEISKATWGDEAVSGGARLQAGAYYKQQYRLKLESLGAKYRDFYQPDQVWR